MKVEWDQVKEDFARKDAEIEALQAKLDECKAKLSSHEKLCVAGIYYTEKEIDESKYQWEKVAIFGAAEHLRRVMTEHPYCDHVQVIRSYFDLSVRANKLKAPAKEVTA